MLKIDRNHGGRGLTIFFEPLQKIRQRIHHITIGPDPKLIIETNRINRTLYTETQEEFLVQLQPPDLGALSHNTRTFVFRPLLPLRCRR